MTTHWTAYPKRVNRFDTLITILGTFEQDVSDHRVTKGFEMQSDEAAYAVDARNFKYHFSPRLRRMPGLERLLNRFKVGRSFTAERIRELHQRVAVALRFGDTPRALVAVGSMPFAVIADLLETADFSAAPADEFGPSANGIRAFDEDPKTQGSELAAPTCADPEAKGTNDGITRPLLHDEERVSADRRWDQTPRASPEAGVAASFIPSLGNVPSETRGRGLVTPCETDPIARPSAESSAARLESGTNAGGHDRASPILAPPRAPIEVDPTAGSHPQLVEAQIVGRSPRGGGYTPHCGDGDAGRWGPTGPEMLRPGDGRRGHMLRTADALVFAPAGGVYRVVGFKESGYLPDRLLGIGLIARLLRSPGVVVPWAECDLALLADRRTEQPVYDASGQRTLAAAVNRLREEIEGAANDVERNDSQKRLNDLTTSIGLATGTRGKARDLNSLLDEIRPKFWGRIKTVVSKLRTANPPMPKLAEHLESYISTNTAGVIYAPASTLTWRTEPVEK